MGGWIKQAKGLAKEHMCMPHGQGQQCGEGQGGKRLREEGEAEGSEGG